MRSENRGVLGPEHRGAGSGAEEGRCWCKAIEYQKLESIDVQSVDDAIRIQLRPRSGETIDEAAVQGCLEYTLEEATKR